MVDAAKDREFLDVFWITDDSGVQLAVKVHCTRFPSRRQCPHLTLYTHLKVLREGKLSFCFSPLRMFLTAVLAVVLAVAKTNRWQLSMQDLLSDQSNLDLDWELKRLHKNSYVEVCFIQLRRGSDIRR